MSSTAASIDVRLAERGYRVEIGAGNLAALGDMLLGAMSPGDARPGATPRGRGKPSRALVVTDEHVRPWSEPVLASLARADIPARLRTLPAGEATKTVAQAEALWRWFLEMGADRKSVVVALGGGVIGDLAGFAAASFARGLDYYQVPTSLLAQVDSSVGGKTGVNLPGAKNIVGAFWQPRGVLIDARVLNTLPQREFVSGLAEVVKYGVILDAAFFAWLENHVADVLARRDDAIIQVVSRCCRLKADVVEADEREETGLRAVLNYGHTFGHAFEAVTEYGRFLHGEAVAIGMECAARLALALGRVDAEFVRRQTALLAAFGLPTQTPKLEVEALLAAMGRDKKTEHGRLRFILPTRLGHVELVDGVAREHAAAAMGL